MAKATIPELKKELVFVFVFDVFYPFGQLIYRFMEKRLMLQLNCSRKVSGILRGYDPFMNLVIEDAYEEPSHELLGSVVIRGNTVVMIEGLDRIN